MDIFYSVLIIVAILSAGAVIFLVLIQHGKGADTGASFGGGASGSVFGASGSANFLSRTTAVFISLFFMSAIGLSYLSLHGSSGSQSSKVLDRITNRATPSEATSNPSSVAIPSPLPSLDPSTQIPR
jgi:preprotein translocase subunit SecG